MIILFRDFGDFGWSEAAGAPGAGPGGDFEFELQIPIFGHAQLGRIITRNHKILNLCRNDVFRVYYRIKSAEND